MGRLSDLRTFASLSPRLLARKGGARPAMRSQLNALQVSVPAETETAAEEDLGWNDMGAEPAPASDLQTAKIANIAPRRRTLRAQAEVIAINPAFVPAPAIEPVPAKTEKAPRRSAVSQGRRAAFTLRLDADRHLKLRLASAAGNRSAQQLVIEALDRLISDTSDIEILAAQVKKRR